MTKDETKALLQRIQIHYPKDIPREYMAVLITDWHRHLSKYDSRWVAEALDYHLESSPYAPKIFDIISQLKAIEQRVHRERLTLPQIEHHAEYIEMPEEVRKKMEALKGRGTL